MGITHDPDIELIVHLSFITFYQLINFLQIS